MPADVQGVECQVLGEGVVVDVLVGNDQAPVIVLERHVADAFRALQKAVGVGDDDLVVCGDLGERARSRRVVAPVQASDEPRVVLLLGAGRARLGDREPVLQLLFA